MSCSQITYVFVLKGQSEFHQQETEEEISREGQQIIVKIIKNLKIIFN
ncbi:MAG: hypothetical protein ACLFPF_07390 [Halanaerobiales bacterium]